MTGSMHGEAVHLEAARLCNEGKGKPSSRAVFEASRFAPLAYAARERCKKATVELAFAQNLCLV
jgi:hypothetical protein